MSGKIRGFHDYELMVSIQFHSLSWIKVTSPAPPLSDPQITAAVPGVKMKALDKAQILRVAELKILPLTTGNRQV